MRLALAGANDPDYYATAATCLYVGLGRYREAIRLFARANELRARRSAKSANHLRVLDPMWFANIGHTATMDYVIKLGRLEGRARSDTILHVPEGARIANRFLFEQFRPLLTIVERSEDLPDIADAARFYYLAPRRADGETVFCWDLAAETYRRWHIERGASLLSFPAEVEQRGWDRLAAIGVARDAWFVTLHVREAGFNPQHRGLHNVLNADISTYVPAIEEITRRGGLVIRIGDPAMALLPPMRNVFDYAHCDFRSDWMDVFLTAKCRFFVGTSSGPAYVPPLYGTRCVLTNWWPPHQRPWHAADIFIPKMCRRLSDGRRLGLSEMLQEPFGFCNSVKYLEESHGVTVEDNDATDIRDAVIEMHRLTSDSMTYDAADLALRDRAEQVMAAGNAPGMAPMAATFLRRHGAELLRE